MLSRCSVVVLCCAMQCLGRSFGGAAEQEGTPELLPSLAMRLPESGSAIHPNKHKIEAILHRKRIK